MPVNIGQQNGKNNGAGFHEVNDVAYLDRFAACDTAYDDRFIAGRPDALVNSLPTRRVYDRDLGAETVTAYIQERLESVSKLE